MSQRHGAAMDVRFEETVPEFLDHITGLGLDHVEFKREYLYGHPEAPDVAELAGLIDSYDVTATLHAPFRDWNMGSFNDASRRAAVDQVRKTLDDAARIGAGAVVVHGGSVPERYPDYVVKKGVQNACESLEECAAYADDVGVPLCLENQPPSDRKRRHTTTPEALGTMLDTVSAHSDTLGVTLDVGHAKVSGYGWKAFAERFTDRIRVLHLHDNDGTTDQHRPHEEYREVADAVPAQYAVLEMKSVADVDRSVTSDT